ncbi:MAG: acid shock protein, partial [Algicola sp.]|nr:acid shock protein [Algicola sp.]
MNKKVPQLFIASMFTLGASTSAFAADTTNTASPQTSVVNTAPIGDAGGDDTVAANTYYPLNGSASYDPEGATLTYLWMQTAGTAVDIFAPQSSNPGFVSPAVTSDETLTFSLDVFDGELRGETVFVNILVKAANQAPVADAGGDDTVAANTYYQFNGSNSHDLEGAELTYLWIQTAGPSVDIFAPQAPNAGFVSPNITTNQTLTFALNVFDGELYSETDTVNILVTANQAPVADAGRDDTVAPNTYYPLNGSNSHDPEGADLTYHWIQTAGPAVDIFAPQAPNPGFVSPNVTTNQTLTFALNVFDGELYSETVFVNILVKVANLPPIADAGRDDSVEENAYYALNGSNSHDPEGAELSYQWMQVAGPAVDIFAPESPNPGFVAPTVDTTQTLTFGLNVFDGELRSDTAMVNIVINKTNLAPIADAGDNSNMKQGGSATLNGTASYDPEGLDIASYQWTQVSGPFALLMNTTSAYPTYVAPVGVTGTMVFQLEVSDGVNTSVLSAL